MKCGLTMKLYFGNKNVSAISSFEAAKMLPYLDLNKVVEPGVYFVDNSVDSSKVNNKPKLTNQYLHYPFNLKVFCLDGYKITQLYEIPSESVLFSRWKTITSDHFNDWIKVSSDNFGYDTYNSIVNVTYKKEKYKGDESKEYTYSNSWRITRIKDTIIHSGRFLTYRDFNLDINSIVENTTKNGLVSYQFKDNIHVPLDFPISSKRTEIHGSIAEGIGQICNLKIINNTVLQFNVCSFNKDIAYPVNNSYPQNSTDNIIRIQVTGQIDSPKSISYMPKNTNQGIKQKIKDLIQSYFDARDNTVNPVKYKYGKNWFSNSSSSVVLEDGCPVMQCDSFVGLILMGQMYSDVYNTEWYKNIPNSQSYFSKYFESKLVSETNLKWAYCNRKKMILNFLTWYRSQN